MIIPSVSQRVGVIEIGSRAVRLLIADVGSSGDFQVVGTDWKETALGNAVSAGGPTLSAKLDELARVVIAYRQKAMDLSASRIAVFGTEAVRRFDAAASERFQALLPGVQVLTGSEEAELSFIAGAMGQETRGTEFRLVIDQGSGSMEIVVGRLRPRLTISNYQSAKLGTQDLVATLRRLGGSFSRLREAVKAQVADLPVLDHAATSTPIVLGSAATKLAWLEVRPDMMKSYDPRLVHGHRVRVSHIDAMVRVAESDPDTAKRIVDPKNPDGPEFETVMAGLVGLEAVLHREGSSGFVVCAHGTRYGFAWKLASAPIRAGRPSRAKSALP